jgi:hypothetical protein
MPLMVIAALAVDPLAEYPATVRTITAPELPARIPSKWHAKLSVSAIELISTSRFPLMPRFARGFDRDWARYPSWSRRRVR